MDFFISIAYTYNRNRRVAEMNHFEKDVQSKRNDLIDSGMGFVWSFGFFTLIFALGVIIKLIAT